MNEKTFAIAEEIKKLTLLEALELVKHMEDFLGIDFSKIQIAQPSSPSLPEAPKEVIEEKSTFDVSLSDVPSDKKIAILKSIRNITGLGLKESKEIVDNFPKIIKEGINKEEVERIKKEIETAGGKILVK